MSKRHVPMFTYNIAVTDGSHMKEYLGYRCTIDAEKDKKSLVDMVRTFVMSHFGAWYDPVVITKKNIDLLDVYKRYKDEPVKRFAMEDVIILEC